MQTVKIYLTKNKFLKMLRKENVLKSLEGNKLVFYSFGEDYAVKKSSTLLGKNICERMI